jgi:hypothetical protein
MARIIKFEKKSKKAAVNSPESGPWEFMRIDRNGKFFIQVPKRDWEKQEDNNGNLEKLPNHIILKGGMSCTIHGVYIYRTDPQKMREVYYLAGLIDCMINRSNPVLRTDLLRDVFKRAKNLKKELEVNWYGHMDQVLLPIEKQYFDSQSYESALSSARTLKELYETIQDGTRRMFDILSAEYLFLLPSEGRYDHGNEKIE